MESKSEGTNAPEDVSSRVRPKLVHGARCGYRDHNIYRLSNAATIYTELLT
jgi:hypothetical protein